MTATSPALRTLRRAAEQLGEARLANILAVPPETLQTWLDGERVPQEVFMTALDIVAGRLPRTRRT